MGKFIVGLIVVVIGAAAGWYYFQGGSAPFVPKGSAPVTTGDARGATPFPDVTITDEQSTGGDTKGGIPVAGSSVTYTDSGYSPKTLTVKTGTTVTFTNASSIGMWTASAMHPTHKVLPGFDALKSVARGGTYTYTFTKVGTWQYHNHVKASDTGVVVVTD